MVTNDILDKIKESNSIAITFHTSPDGDSLGSALGLLQGLRKLNKKTYILSKEPTPETFKYLPYSEEITGDVENPTEDTDCVIVLDCGNIERINAELDLQNKKYALINIDHHLSNDMYGDFNFVDTKASAVAEVVYKLLQKLEINIDKDIAICLYTSLITDTGSFRYPSTTSETHNIAGCLVDAGINFNLIHRKIFENKTFNRLKLYGKVLDEMYLENEKLCVMKVTKNMLEELNMEDAKDTSDIISQGMQIGTVEVAVLFKEVEEGVKISLRSKEYVDVRKIAESFGGGGHIRASGAFVKGKTLDIVERKLIETIKKELI
ncbi:DHH family phosphoesterase [Clostridium tepidum]|jgi:phosphoesterase RecJ-like protein|uniref:DHH family phosphoesterase n=1 Tax=Clostridium tepidum TaxID=1962263 RepID=A0A1S9IFX7_9CLOT|nr:bifunctional oligoribonuclease/PAP phosphatase NrnA [Clostridium tepidum]MCR1933958.1 bifunctional oligoribonuclease/PAP phosphatase NrnA [Clostridium tepidum]MDU6877753.1 bifunctional oligoribonuclease/PAP phosphatase NrnA [Clostridium botulinum]OOO63376.1 DHH family phosphoesterase [Clostridium tepidum]OOO69216.1 DHH family phosphoesterase [Clostridium tepidum]